MAGALQSEVVSADFIQSIAVREMGQPFSIPDGALLDAYRAEAAAWRARRQSFTPEDIVLVMVYG